MTQKFDYNFILLFSETGKYEKSGLYDFLDERFIYKSKDLDTVIPKLFKY